LNLAPWGQYLRRVSFVNQSKTVWEMERVSCDLLNRAVASGVSRSDALRNGIRKIRDNSSYKMYLAKLRFMAMLFVFLLGLRHS
jgi:hypothetical protein